MRTTIDLPDELVRAARVRAAEGDETLKELFLADDDAIVDVSRTGQ